MPASGSATWTPARITSLLRARGERLRKRRTRNPGSAVPRGVTVVWLLGYMYLSSALPLSQAADPAGGPVWGVADEPKRSQVVNPKACAAKPPGMVWVPGGAFTMGTDDPESWPAERPAHRVRISGFWMDVTEVTNTQFADFVEATNYVTVAQRPIDWEEMKKQLPPGTPRPPEEMLQPGSLVFTPPDRPVPFDNPAMWWRWMSGASWRHPEGPGTSIKGRENHPVVHIAWEDAVAYSQWAGKRLPTEAEWECAARGGLQSARFVWGDEPVSETKARANIWQGEFPHHNTKADGFVRTAPVGSFTPNGYGLHDMAGNVWEWCADWYRADLYARRAARLQPGEVVQNPGGPNSPWSPTKPREPVRVTKGGSFLCHVSYCTSYRPSARMGTAADTGLSHIGFRCVMTRAMWEQRRSQLNNTEEDNPKVHEDRD